MDYAKLLPAYVAWVNSQLRKAPNHRLVSDLSKDFQDGTVLSQLYEIISGCKLMGIEPSPKTVNTKRKNVEKVLQVMERNRMDTSFVTAKDVNDGNLRSIMKLILELAKHYKPKSVPSVQIPVPIGYGSLDNRKMQVTNKQQNCSPKNCASPKSERGLRVIRKNETAIGTCPRGRILQEPQSTNAGFRPNSINKLSTNFYREALNGDTDGDYAGTDSDVSSSKPTRPSYRWQTNFQKELINECRNRIDWQQSTRKPAGSEKTAMVPAKSLPCLQASLRSASADGYRDYENVPMQTQHDFTAVEVSRPPTDKFLTGHTSDNVDVKRKQSTANTFAGTSTEVKLVALQSYLQQTSEKCHELQSTLQKSKQECATLEDSKIDLQKKAAQQEKCILQMKHELAKLQLSKQSLETEKEELVKSLQMKDEQLIELRRQLNGKDKVIYQQKAQFDDAIRNLSMSNKAKACLASRLTDQDRKIALLEQARSHKIPIREELQVVHDALHSLRSGFRRNDPQHHTIDTLEQSFSLLMDKLHLADIQTMNNNQQMDSKRLNFDSTGDPRRSPLTSYHGYCLQKLDNTNNGTKVVYFTEKTLTPFMSSIPKCIGEARLKDFKIMFDRPGNFRFHFKSVDPEYGMVKEEVLHDEDILPGWDGKIIAWVEEDHG